VELELYHRASNHATNKTKKRSAGPPTPATTFQGKKLKKKKTGSRGENPAGLTARGAWAEAQSTKTMARRARAMAHAPRLTRRSAGAEGLVYRVFINQPHDAKNQPRESEKPTARSANCTG